MIDFFAVVFLENRIFVLNFARISHVKSQTNQIYSPATIFMEKVIDYLLTQLKVKHTGIGLRKEVGKVPLRDSLWAVSKILDSYSVANTSFRLSDKSKISELATPFVVEYEGRFYVVMHANDTSIIYSDGHSQEEKSTTEFMTKWGGVIMLVAADGDSAEPDFDGNKRQERQSLLERVGVACCLTVMLVSSVYVHREALHNVLFLCISLLCVAGLMLSSLLLKTHLHLHSTVAEQLCSVFKQSSCQSGDIDAAPRFLGKYDLSELGIAYFFVNTVALAVFPTQCISGVALSTAVAIPFSIWSIAYQRLRMKKWCVMCLMVMLTVWAMFACLVGEGFYMSASFSVYTVALLASYMPVLYLTDKTVAFRTRLQQAENELHQLQLLKYDKNIWAAALNDSPCHDSDVCSSIVFGPVESDKPELTILSNPYCSPCARLHAQLQSLIVAGYRIRYVFTYFSKELEEVNRRIIAYYADRGAEATWRLLEQWYERQPRNADEVLPPVAVDVQEELGAHERWVEQSGLIYTPTVLVGGHELPSHYSIEDLLFIY